MHQVVHLHHLRMGVSQIEAGMDRVLKKFAPGSGGLRLGEKVVVSRGVGQTGSHLSHEVFHGQAGVVQVAKDVFPRFLSLQHLLSMTLNLDERSVVREVQTIVIVRTD